MTAAQRIAEWTTGLTLDDIPREVAEAAGVSAELIVKPGGSHPWPTIHEEVAVLADWFDGQLADK